MPPLQYHRRTLCVEQWYCATVRRASQSHRPLFRVGQCDWPVLQLCDTVQSTHVSLIDRRGTLVDLGQVCGPVHQPCTTVRHIRVTNRQAQRVAYRRTIWADASRRPMRLAGAACRATCVRWRARIYTPTHAPTCIHALGIARFRIRSFLPIRHLTYPWHDFTCVTSYLLQSPNSGCILKLNRFKYLSIHNFDKLQSVRNLGVQIYNQEWGYEWETGTRNPGNS